MIRFSRALLIVLFAGSACLAMAQSNDRHGALDAVVQSKVQSFPGKVSLSAKNLLTGETYGLDADSPVRTASTIKLAIMAECFFEAAEGKLDMSERIKIPEDEKVSGSGIVQELSTSELPVRDLIDLMIVLSDNTATNLILNRIGGNAVNARMKQLGFVQTRVMRKILGDGNDLKTTPSGITEEGLKPENKKWGIGRSSPNEMVAILDRLYHGELVSKSASEEMLTILKRQRDRDGIGRDLKDTVIASKSGALDRLRSDVGIIYSEGGPTAMAITVDDMPTTNWTPDNPGSILIASLSESLLNGLSQHR